MCVESTGTHRHENRETFMLYLSAVTQGFVSAKGDYLEFMRPEVNGVVIKCMAKYACVLASSTRWYITDCLPYNIAEINVLSSRMINLHIVI